MSDLEEALKVVGAVVAAGRLGLGAANYLATVRKDADSRITERAAAARRFWELYWGELSMVENPEVEAAMVQMGNCLNGNCSGARMPTSSNARSRSLTPAAGRWRNPGTFRTGSIKIKNTLMQLYPIDDDRRLFISGDLRDWSEVVPYEIDVVIDVDGGLDAWIPTHSNHCLYIYFPFDDDDQILPSASKLRAIAQLAASLIQDGHRVLAHCGMGYNRSGLVAGLILKALGVPGAAAVTRIRERRPGALFNDRFADYLALEQAGKAGEAG